MEPSDEELIRSGKKFHVKREVPAARITRFCKKERLPYPAKFVSVTVLRSGEDICDSPARMYGHDGNPFERTRYAVLKMNERVLRNLDIVGRDDLLQLLTEMADRLKRNQPFDSLRKMLRDLRGMNLVQKRKALLWATMDRRTHGYSEARLSRELTADDVEQWGRCD